VEEIHMSHNVGTTRIEINKDSSQTPTPYKPPKNVPHKEKTLYTPSKMNVPYNVSTQLEYYVLEDLKRTKANISLFELLKLPQIHDNFIKTLQGKTTKSSK
jgi:hypothetical protein